MPLRRTQSAVGRRHQPSTHLKVRVGGHVDVAAHVKTMGHDRAAPYPLLPPGKPTSSLVHAGPRASASSSCVLRRQQSAVGINPFESAGWWTCRCSHVAAHVKTTGHDRVAPYLLLPPGELISFTSASAPLRCPASSCVLRRQRYLEATTKKTQLLRNLEGTRDGDRRAGGVF